MLICDTPTGSELPKEVLPKRNATVNVFTVNGPICDGQFSASVSSKCNRIYTDKGFPRLLSGAQLCFCFQLFNPYLV